jgi:hypothetical protein
MNMSLVVKDALSNGGVVNATGKLFNVGSSSDEVNDDGG